MTTAINNAAAPQTVTIDTTASNADQQAAKRKTPTEIREELEAQRLTEERLAHYLEIVEKASTGKAEDYEEACSYLTTQTDLDAKAFYAIATRLGETAARRLAAYGKDGTGLACSFVACLTDTKLTGKAILDQFYRVLYYHFGGAVEGREWEYDKDSSIVVIQRPKKAYPVVTLRKGYDPAVLQRAGKTLKQYKGKLFEKEYKPLASDLVSPLVTLCKAAVKLIDALEYVPKDSSKPNKVTLALQLAARADLAKAGQIEADFCQTYLKPLIALGKQLDKPTLEPADVVTRKAEDKQEPAAE